jgi:hypothetical protein
MTPVCLLFPSDLPEFYQMVDQNLKGFLGFFVTSQQQQAILLSAKQARSVSTSC